MRPRKSKAGIALAIVAGAASIATFAIAAEKEGLRVEVVPKLLVDRSASTNSTIFTTAVDQDMALKATIKNISMKDNPEGSIDYVVLVQRWNTETPSYSRFNGTQ